MLPFNAYKKVFPTENDCMEYLNRYKKSIITRLKFIEDNKHLIKDAYFNQTLEKIEQEYNKNNYDFPIEDIYQMIIELKQEESQKIEKIKKKQFQKLLKMIKGSEKE